MFDFTQGFTTIPAQPSPGKLNLAPEMDLQVRGFGEMGKGWGTLGSLFGSVVGEDYVRAPDVTKIFDGNMWNYDSIRKVTSYDEQTNLEHLLTVLGGGKQDIASYIGAAFEPNQIMVMRQLLGSGPLSPVSYGDSELAPEILAEDAKQLRELTKAQEGITPNENNLTPEQKQIVALTQKLSFAEAKKQTQERVGFSWFDWMKESNIFWGGVNYLFDSPALKDKDIKDVLTRKDPNFDPKTFWDKHTEDPRVAQGLLERGITEEFIEDSPNEEHARFKIGQAYLTSHVQQRINTYKPTYTDYATATAYALPKMMVEFMLDTPTGAVLTPLHAVELLLSPLAPTTTALGEMTAIRVGTGIAETLYKLPIGMVPRWMAGTTLLSRIPAYFTAGAVVGATGGYARQAHEISFAAATMYANPFVRQDIDYGDIALESFYTGTQFAAMFGVGFGLIGTAKGVLDNRFKGMIVDPKTKARNLGDRRWSLEDTLLGNTIDKFRKRDSLIDVSPVERVKAEAILENKEATPERLAAEVEGRAERVETKEALSSPEKAEASPEDVGARKYETETVEQYTARLAPSRGFKELTEIATEVARRSPSENNNSRMLDTETELSAMSEQDKIRTLIRTKAVLEDARKKEEAAVGLPKERERVYDELESRRKAWIKNLRKDLTPLEFKKLKAEVLGERARNTTPLPKLLETAKNSSKPLAERKTAAVDAANEILEAARSAATNPEKAKVIVEKIPDELRDRFNAAVVEKKLTGTIAGETAEQIRASMLDEKAPAVETSIARSIRRSVSVSRLDPARVSKIAAIKRDYTKFVDLATGNKERATNLYLTVDEMFRRGLITKEDRVLLLASVVHLNFDMKGFDIRYKFEAMGDNTAGAYRATDKTLFINTNKIRASQTAVFLHELGHALFANEANGSIYLENLKLYNSIRSRPLENTYSFAKKDPLLRESGIFWYHFQNAEETFVELFSKVLLAEAGAVKDLSPAETSLVRSVFGSIQGAVVTAVTYLDSSKYYSSANKVIKMITDMDSAMAKENISVPALIRAFEVAESESKLESDVFRRAFGKEAISNKTRADAFNAAVKKYFEKQDAKYKTKFANSSNIPQLTEGEFTFLFKTMQDARGLAAFAISRKANKPLIDAKGAFTKEMKSFVDTYSIYKKTQYNSLLTRLAFLLESQSYKTILGMSKEERLDFVVYTLFDINARETKDARLDKPLPATYEDEPLALMNIGDGNYATDYLFTTGEDIVSALEKWDAPDVGTRDVLSAADRDALVSSIRDNDIAMTPLIDMVRAKFDETGLMELGDRVVGKLHVSFIKKMLNESVFNMEDSVVNTPAFKQWFKNSKVVDAEGKPTIVYHGTINQGDFSVFNKDASNYGLFGAGFYFTESAAIASEYAGVRDGKLRKKYSQAGSVYPVYLQIENPIDMDAKIKVIRKDGIIYDDVFGPALETYDPTKSSNKNVLSYFAEGKDGKERTAQFKDEIKNMFSNVYEDSTYEQIFKRIEDSIVNYVDDGEEVLPYLMEDILKHAGKDGITHLGGGRVGNGQRHRVYIAFDSTQIKSIWNKGTFDPTNADIRLSPDLPEDSRLSVDTKQKAMGLIGSMLREKSMLTETTPEKILKTILKFDDQTTERLSKASGNNTKKALEMAIRGIREEYLEYDGVNWTTKRIRVEADEVPTLPTPRKAKIVGANKAAVDPKNIDNVLMDLVSNASKTSKDIDPVLDEARGNVLGDMLSADTQRRTKLIEFVAEGRTAAEIRSYINTAIKREKIDLERSRKLGEDIQNDQGVEKTAKKLVGADKTKKRDLNKDKYFGWLEAHKTLEEKTGTGIFNETQLATLKALTEDRVVTLADGKEEVVPKILEDLAKEWGLKGKSGARARILALEKHFAKTLGFSEADKAKFLDSENKISKEELDSFVERAQVKIAELTKEEAPKPKKAKEAAPEEPLPTSEEAAEAGKQIIEDQAIAAKMDAPSEPVPVLTSEASEGHAVVETSNLPAAPEGEPPVVRAEKVADALVSAEDNMTKTAVKLEVKKAYSMSGVFTKSSVKALDRLVTLIALSEPRAMAKIAKEQRRQFVIDLLKEKGYDALVDEKGNVIPLDKIKIVGKVKKTKAVVENTEPGTEIKEVTKITTEGDNVPVVETTTQAVEPTAPTGVVSAVEADKPAIVQPVVKIESKVEPMPEEEVLERRANEDVKLLRENGMDRPFLRLFTKAYWKSGIEAKGKEALTDKLKAAWGDFTLVNQFIAEANRKIFGEDVMDRFWAKVDEINAKDRIRVKGVEDPTKVKPLTYTEVLDKAAEAMNEEGKPEFVRPLLPSEIKFVKADEAGNVRLSGKNKKTRAIIDEATKDQTVAEAPPVDRKLDAEGKEVAPTEEDLKPVDAPSDDTPRKTNDEVIDAAIDQNESGASRPWRLNTFAGWLFGGDSAANANWWRKTMAKLANATQSGSKLGNTIRSMIDDVAFLSRFADDGRAQTGHVVREGERARKTMLQIKMEEGMMITRVLRAYSMFADSIRGADRAAVNMYMYEQLRQGKDINRADLIALGVSPRTADAALKNGTYLMNIVRAVNNKVLYLERSTGRLATVDRNGIPLDPKMYAPVQFDHEALSRINPADYGTVIEALARARRNTKLNDPRLDKNTMIVMGWIGVERDPKTGQVAIYDKNRILKHSEAVNMFTNETLSKLRTDEDGRQLPRVVKQGVAGNKALLKNLLKNSEPDKYFWIETDDAFTAYRLPRVIEDLGAADRLRYTEAVNGNTGMYIESWREWLGGKDLIYREMEEMFAYKTKQYPYNDANHGLLRPMFRIGENGPKGVMVHGLTPEEMLSDPLLSGLLRTNLSEAYFHWLRGRYFDLAFQSELDTVMGTTGINWEMITDRVQRKNIDNLKKIAHQASWTNEQLKQAISDLTSGIERLNEEFRVGAETLPFLPSTSNKTTRLANAAIRYKFSVGYGISQFTEIMQELAKETPEFYRLPANVFKAIRYVVGDYRFSKNKLLMSELGDMTFVLESMKTDLSNRFMGETGYGTLSMDSQARTGMSRVAQRFRDAHGFGDKLISVFEAGAEGMQALGSLGAQTQAVRALGKVRIQRSVWKYFESKAIDRLIENLDKPENAAMLDALKKAAAADQTVQPKLWKAFADIARKSGFGFDQHDAMMLRIYGFTEKETVEALRWAFSKTSHKEGRVNMHDLWDLVDYARRENVKGVNPDVLERAVSNYQFMIEDKITKEVASEVRGLNRNTSLAARSDLGRLWYSLTSFITSYQDNVIMNHARKNSIKYIAGGIFLYMVLDSLTSYFKEYLAGRQADDILKEMEDHPSDFFIRGMARTPFLGLYNSVLEMGMAGASALNGGTYRFYGIPLMPAGATAGVGALEDVYTDAKNIVAKPGVADKIKAASGLLGATDIINKHHIAIPVRVLEDLGAIERKSAIGTYLDIIHRKPYPYMKQGGYGTPTITGNGDPISLEGYQVSPKNYAKESQDYAAALEARYQQEYPKPKQTTLPSVSTSPNKGVSGILGDLLGNNQ